MVDAHDLDAYLASTTQGHQKRSLATFYEQNKKKQKTKKRIIESLEPMAHANLFRPFVQKHSNQELQ